MFSHEKELSSGVDALLCLVSLPELTCSGENYMLTSEAAQFFSLSAFRHCLTSLVLICIYMYKINHVNS